MVVWPHVKYNRTPAGALLEYIRCYWFFFCQMAAYKMFLIFSPSNHFTPRWPCVTDAIWVSLFHPACVGQKLKSAENNLCGDNDHEMSFLIPAPIRIKIHTRLVLILVRHCLEFILFCNFGSRFSVLRRNHSFLVVHQNSRHTFGIVGGWSMNHVGHVLSVCDQYMLIARHTMEMAVWW